MTQAYSLPPGTSEAPGSAYGSHCCHMPWRHPGQPIWPLEIYSYGTSTPRVSSKGPASGALPAPWLNLHLQPHEGPYSKHVLGILPGVQKCLLRS